MHLATNICSDIKTIFRLRRSQFILAKINSPAPSACSIPNSIQLFYRSSAAVTIEIQQSGMKEREISMNSGRKSESKSEKTRHVDKLKMKLSGELEKSHAQNALSSVRRRVNLRVVTDILADRVNDAFTIADSFISRTDHDVADANIVRDDSELISAVILTAARGIVLTGERPNHRLIKRCIELGKLRQLDSNALAAMLLLRSAVSEHISKNTNVSNWESLSRMIESCIRKLSLNRPINDGHIKTFRTEMENCKVEAIGATLDPVFNDGLKLEEKYLRQQISQGLRYDCSSLTEDLQANSTRDQYNGSPYSGLGLHKADLLNKWRQQVAHEMDGYISVKNIWSLKHDKTTAEHLIDQWGWRANIEAELKQKMDIMLTEPLKTLLSFVPLNKFVDVAMRIAMNICACGTNIVPLIILQNQAGEDILRFINYQYQAKFQFYNDNIMEKIFSDYTEYFTNMDVPRQLTNRELWTLCCYERDYHPQLSVPLASSFSHPDLRARIGTLILETLTNVAMFDFDRRTPKYPAFHQRIERMSNVKLTTFGHRKSDDNDGERLKNDRRKVRVIGIDSRLASMLERQPFSRVMFDVTLVPMLVPPRPWLDDCTAGGLYTVRTSVVRAPSCTTAGVHSNQEQQMRCRLKSTGQLRPIADALNDLGSTPWLINEPVLDVMLELFNRRRPDELADKLNMVGHASTMDVPKFLANDEKPTDEQDYDERMQKWKLYYRKVGEWKAKTKEKNELNSLWSFLMYRLTLADHFRGKLLYFPHNMDFRGRVYPMAPYLNHMGDDVSRGIMRFARGKPLGEHGLDWLKLHCINLAGKVTLMDGTSMKVKMMSAKERLAFADSILDKIIDSADRPLQGDLWWTESEDPWETLAACVEIRNAVNSGHPAAFVSHLPVHQDGSCNGLQHYAALGRDERGAFEVNLFSPNTANNAGKQRSGLVCDYVPQDIYAKVAERVEKLRQRDEQLQANGLFKSRYLSDPSLIVKFRQLFPDPIDRRTIKQTVMTTVYGVTFLGAANQIRRQLRSLNIDEKLAHPFSFYLARLTLDSLHESFSTAMNLKNWFRHCAATVAGRNCLRPMEYITRLNLPVVQPYVQVVYNNKLRYISPQFAKQVNAFPPNFIHSLDAVHMMLTALHCRRLGVTYASVHDCFWTHAASVSTMNEMCRKEFVKMHQAPIVDDLAEFLRNKLIVDQSIGDSDRFDHLNTTLRAPDTVGNFDLHKVNDSVYFFS